MVSLRPRMGPTVRPRERLPITHTRGLPRGPPRFLRRMEAQLPDAPTILTPGRLPPPGKVPTHTHPGGVRYIQKEGRAPILSIILLRRGRWDRCRPQPEEGLPALRPHMATPPSARRQEATCMQVMTETFTKIPARDGKNMTTGAGPPSRHPLRAPNSGRRVPSSRLPGPRAGLLSSRPSSGDLHSASPEAVIRCDSCSRRPRTGKGARNRASAFSSLKGPAAAGAVGLEAGAVAASAVGDEAAVKVESFKGAIWAYIWV
jgi:hypothetical protein